MSMLKPLLQTMRCGAITVVVALNHTSLKVIIQVRFIFATHRLQPGGSNDVITPKKLLYHFADWGSHLSIWK
jgi:hypothetical protein